MFAHFGLIVYARSRCDLCFAITSDRGSETARACTHKRTHTRTHTKRHRPNTLARATKGAHKSTTRRRYVPRPLEIEHGATHTAQRADLAPVWWWFIGSCRARSQFVWTSFVPLAPRRPNECSFTRPPRARITSR